MKYGKIKFGIFVGIFLFSTSIPAFLQAEEPGKLIVETINRGLTILQDPSLKEEQKAQERRERLWEEISPIFDFEEMSKRALGMHWRKRSPAEKSEFVELFTILLKNTYIGETDTYSGEKIVYLKEEQDNHHATVQTKFITSKGTEVSVDYRLLNNEKKWGIYDVIIEGVSLVNNYRSQFNDFLIKSPYEALVQRIKEKNKEGISTK